MEEVPLSTELACPKPPQDPAPEVGKDAVKGPCRTAGFGLQLSGTTDASAGY